ncbi:unnamed protein product [Phytophthora lilii]|uniref:Unnamed protein product n=1 Tax=Phytophthora lilii TaxID=2077276 RepID=A0A9W6YK34_9STRA|nr:unnamed protein product [Phytophthora lilii]
MEHEERVHADELGELFAGARGLAAGVSGPAGRDHTCRWVAVVVAHTNLCLTLRVQPPPGTEEEEDNAELLSPARASQTSDGNASSAAENEEPEESATEEAPVSTVGAKTPLAASTRSTPPPSGSGNKLAGFVSAISTQLENVSSGRGGDPPLSNGGPQSASTEEECARLHKDLTRVRNELRLKDKQLSSTQKSMQICEEELVALEQECKEKIAQVQHEDKSSDEQNFIQALEMKDNQARAMKADLDALAEAKEQYTAEIASLKAELAKALESKDTLWTSAASASNESEQLIESLRSELQDTLTAMNNLKREYAESKNTMFSRQSQLESTNTELVNNVANLERELAKAKEAVAAASQTSSSGTASTSANSGSAHFGANASMNDDYRRVQQTLVLTKKTLHDESRKNEVQKQEIISLTEEVRRLKQALEAAQESSSKQLEATSQENEQLKEQVKQLTSHSSVAAAANGELRIQRLTNRLIEKQETIDSLRSRVTTMDVRLQDVQLRAQRAEEKLARMEQNGGIDDMEMATPVGKPGRGGMRSRPNRMAHMISRVAPVVERSHRVVTALDVLDRWLLFLGRSTRPLSRQSDVFSVNRHSGALRLDSSDQDAMSPTPDAPVSTASEGVASMSSVHVDANATDAEIAWLRRCLPIFVQPDVDIKNRNDLVKIFFRFERDDQSGHLLCKLCIVFAGESSYNRVQEEIENSLATLCYRTFNRRTNVDLDPNAAVPWATIYSQDHGGKQQWAQGEKKNLGNWFSLMHHYHAEIGYSDWKLHPQTHRPYIYLNTCNHMIGEKDNNPKLSKFNWIDYPFQQGDGDDAFRYVVEHVPTKCNLYSYFCFWRARNGGGWCDRHPGGKSVSRDGKSIYVKYPSTTTGV